MPHIHLIHSVIVNTINTELKGIIVGAKIIDRKISCTTASITAILRSFRYLSTIQSRTLNSRVTHWWLDQALRVSYLLLRRTLKGQNMKLWSSNKRRNSRTYYLISLGPKVSGTFQCTDVIVCLLTKETFKDPRY